MTAQTIDYRAWTGEHTDQESEGYKTAVFLVLLPGIVVGATVLSLALWACGVRDPEPQYGECHP